MRPFVLLWLLWLLPICTAHAQGDIHRCMGANGIPVFTDRVCSDVNATPTMPTPAATSSAPAEVAQPPAVLCAADMKQLKQAVVDAFAERNPNRLAGLALWNGDGQATVVTDIRFFSRLMSHPLIGVKTVSASGNDDNDADASALSLSSSPSPAPSQGEALIVQTESDDGSGAAQSTRFDVVHRSGCMWLQPQG
ncbi:MAG TPA: DUF4124 domain-containing protein [Dyella sp.]|nr:DUF4124 domain-containing protein [Dyella sp.]